MRILLILLMPFFSTCAIANSLKVDSFCRQTETEIIVHVPITKKNADTSATYNKLLHIECTDALNNECYGVVLRTDIPKNGVKYFDVTPMRGIVAKVNRKGYVVLEWGIHVITVDFQNQKLTWVELAGEGSSSGSAICK